MKKTVYQVGDRVKILEPKWVDRVGYNLHYQDLIDEARDDPKTAEAYRILMGEPHGLWLSKDKIPYYFVITVAKLMVEQRNFGGPERKIHYRPGNSIYRGAVLEVTRKRVVTTGVRCPGYIAGYGEDQEWISASLEDRKTHVLLLTEAGEIEACNVERVWKAGTK